MTTGRITAFVAAGFLLAGAAMAAKTNYVSLAGTQTVSPYTSWALATTNIQDAINDTVAGDTVLVSNGTYYINDQISITTAITVRSLWGASSTIVARAASGTNAPQHRIFSNSAAATLDGFTVQNGYLKGPSQYGGGIYMSAGTVQNCVIRTNVITYAWPTLGGGVYISGGTLQFCTIISNNNGGDGGGVYQDRATVATPSLVQSNTIACNYGGGGGGLYITGGATGGRAVAQHNIIEYNTGGNGGGVNIVGYYNPLLTNCVIRFNTGNQGGGLNHAAGTEYIDDCTIVSNTATSLGGGIYGSLTYGPVSFRNCTISGNIHANYPGIYIAGIGGGSDADGNIKFENCRITDNVGKRSVYIGALYITTAGYIVTFRNCTISANQQIGIDVTTIGYHVTGVVTNQNAYPLIQNTIIYNHTTNIFSTNAATLTAILANAFTNSCSPQLTAPGLSNVTDDPLFLLPAAGDYHFKSISPCAYTGTTNVFSLYTSDMEHVPYSGNRINMGCYETMQMIWKGTVFRIQ